MIYRTSNRDVKADYYYVLPIGYCNADYLLKGARHVAYTCGVYGWNSDIYEADCGLNLAISTGYRPVTGQRIKKPSYDVLKKYDDKARRIWCGEDRRYKTYDGKTKAIRKLLNAYITECKLC